MSSSKQKTLFQSWGGGNASFCRGKGEKPERGRGQEKGRGQDRVPVIDLCEEEEDEEDEEEDILLAHALDISCAEEFAPKPSNSKSGTFISPVRKSHTNLFSTHGAFDQKETKTEDGNVSVGAEDIQENLPPTNDTVSGKDTSHLHGFDEQAGRLWIYPTNYPVRDYQYNIVQKCLYKNTMVTLPTGLGKTFIAAVVMYNFYQWYPQGKIVFMAPTKPLVAQQIDACYNIMGIPHSDTAEMTGTMNPNERRLVWKERRVFFLTPQVMTNDLSRGTCPAADVRCLVIDEAHRALGNHAYCQVVRELVKYTQEFRVLALSATPGSDIKAVQQVISNLLVSQIELRTEECLDIKPYTHERRVDKIVVPLGQELSSLRDQYTQVMSTVVQRLIRHRALYNRDPASLSKFLILKAREAFRQDPPQQLPRQQYGAVEGDFALALSLYHGYELLQLHGLRSLYNFLQTILSGEKGHGRTRTELLKSHVFLQVMDTLRHKFDQDESILSSTQKKSSYVSAHPKMKKLEEVVLEHFDKVYSDGGTETRVMIFSQYRDSVQGITNLLNLHQPRVKAMSFIGQSSAGKSTKGFTQKEQLKVMKEFREGGYNTLISTCVGEEGLDIGDIDLIICFDAHKSPIRLVQRMGRTGRKRQGRIVMLVTQGKEEQIYNQSQYSKRSIHKAIMNGARSLHFYQANPRMLPAALSPVCHKMFITVKHTQTKPQTATKTIKAQKKITSFDKGQNQDGKKESSEDGTLTQDEWRELQEYLVPAHDLRSLPVLHASLLSLNPDQPAHLYPEKGSLSLNEWVPWQNRLQTTKLVDHSTRSRHLVELMEFIQLQELLEVDDNQYSLEMEKFLNLDDVLESGQDDEAEVLETAPLPKQQKLVDVGGAARRGGGRRKGRMEVLPALCGLEMGEEEEEEEDLPVFDVGCRSPDGHEDRAAGCEKQLNRDEEQGSSSVAESNFTKQKRRKNSKAKSESTFLETLAVNDSGEFEKEKTVFLQQFSDKPMCSFERRSSRTTCPRDVTISFVKSDMKNKLDLSQYHESKVFKIPSPPPFDEISDVFSTLDELPPVNVVTLVSEWYKETMGKSVQVRWAESEAVEVFSESHTAATPGSEICGAVWEDDSKNSDTSSLNDDNQMHFEFGVDSESKESTPEAPTFTSIQAKVTPNISNTNHNDRKCSREDYSGAINHTDSLTEHDDLNIPRVPLDVRILDPERTAAFKITDRTETASDSRQDGNTTFKINENQSRKTLSHQSLPDHNSACEVRSVKDCLTFTQAMACIQSSEEFSQALSQVSSLSPEPLTAQNKGLRHLSSDRSGELSADQLKAEKNTDLSPDQFDTHKSCELSPNHFDTHKSCELSPNHFDTHKSCELSPNHFDTHKSCELSPDQFDTHKSCELSPDQFEADRDTHLSKNHLVTHKNKDSSPQHLIVDRNSEDSPDSDILLSEMPSFNLFDDVSDVDMSKEVASALEVPCPPPCPAASFSDTSDQGVSAGGSEHKTAVCDSRQADLVEDEFDMPHFELNFDLDDDIIPPSPQVSQTFSQKSFNRSQSAPSSKCRRDLCKTALESMIVEDAVGETLAESSGLCDGSNAALSLQPGHSTTTEHLTTKDAAPKTPYLLSPLPGQVRSSTPKQRVAMFTNMKKVGGELRNGEEDERGEERKEPLEPSVNYCALSDTWTAAVSPSSRLTHTVFEGVKERDLSLGLDDESLVEMKKRKAAPILEDSEDSLLLQHGASSFKTPSRPLVGHRKRLKMDRWSRETSGCSTSARSSDDTSASCLLDEDDADDFVSVDQDRSVGDTRCHKQSRRNSRAASFKRQPKRWDCQFLDREAVLSGDSTASSDEALNSQDDMYELSFVNDHTQMSQLDVDMQAVYLKSVHSPVEMPDRFRLQPRHLRRQVFSPGAEGDGEGGGVMDEESGDEYEEDSFCVAEGQDDTEYFEEEEDVLDELEDILRNGKRKNKVAKTKTERLIRKRIRHFSGSFSEDECKALLPVSLSDDTQDLTANRQDVLDLLCSQRPDPGPRRRKINVCSSDEETSPRMRILNECSADNTSRPRRKPKVCSSDEETNQSAQLHYPGQGVSAPHSHLLSPVRDSVCPGLEPVTFSTTGHKLEQEELLKEMNEKKTLAPAMLGKKSGSEAQDRSRTGHQLHNTERLPLINSFNPDLQDFDFVSDELKTSIAKPLDVNCRRKEQMAVMVDSRELSGAQDIISSLRLKHGYTVAVRQLGACDYILSCRLAVDRRQLSEFSNGANRSKLTERLQRMRELYDRCCLIVERDRLKPGDSADRTSHRSKYYDWVQALLIHTNIRLFYTDNQDETSGLLAQLAEMEKKKGMNISVPLDVSPEKEQCIKFYSSIPKLNYAHALHLAHSYPSIKQFISRCSLRCLSAAGQMSEVRAADVLAYVKHTFDLQMLPTRR